MWEKYADQGRGFLVEFDPSHSWFQQKVTENDDLRHLRRVAYVVDRTPAYLLAITAQDYLYTKETKWEYEKEWRIILNFNGAACKVGKDNTGTDVLLFAIPPDCLLSATVGYNASHAFVEQVRTAVSANPSLSHVGLRAARRREDGSIEIGAIARHISTTFQRRFSSGPHHPHRDLADSVRRAIDTTNQAHRMGTNSGRDNRECAMGKQPLKHPGEIVISSHRPVKRRLL